MDSDCAQAAMPVPREYIWKARGNITVLKYTMIPEGHRPRLFFKGGDLLFLRSMVWVMRAVGELVKTEHSELGRDIVDEEISFNDTAVPTVFLERR